ncbi:Protein zer-1 [Chionoecetes opilio]|uniref:Protein zer-1 homolog n=1 Tax=Chionoecetes opilio TaxID=41210 RepID=A0A8J4YLE1_CHIOP|nr:Protein zer-1 [Chionoecetes opilio]
MSLGSMNTYCPWEDNSPEPLLDICGKYVIAHPETFCVKHQLSGLWFLRPGSALPTELCERLIGLWQDLDPEKLDDRFINIFRDLSNTRLKRINLRSSSVSDDGLSVLLSHNLIELDISNCRKLSERTLANINKKGGNLLTLVIGKTNDILPSTVSLESSSDKEDSPASEAKQKDYILRTPNLRKLVVRDLIQPRYDGYFVVLLKPLTRLTHLDLSGCFYLHDIKYLRPMKHLVSINLHSAQRVQDAIPVLSEIKTLKFLDVSQANQTCGMFEYPDTTLANLVTSLPNLASLDISGTNLSGDGTFDERSSTETRRPDLCDIPGLRCRINNPLEFLGLYNTLHDACHRNHIPAKVITGDANEEQILAAMEAYVDRPDVLVKALNELFHIFRFETCHNQNRALNLILLAMLRHRREKHIQISGSASLFYIAKSEDKNSLSVRARQKMIIVLLDAMETHLEDSTMMRNGCLTLCQFRIPQDVASLFEYRRLVQLLLHLIKGRGDGDDFVRRIAIYLLNSLACQVDGEQKELVGDLGAIETMLKLINDRLHQHVHDDMLEIAWSAMWNVTDETPVNCLRFLNGEGMRYFQKCLKASVANTFPDKPELLRNMMGLLGNVAEVKDLRHRLMTPELLTTFADLLDSNSDGIEVSYNAAGVLSHIASGGAEAWTIDCPTRAEVLERMVAAIERWDLASKRNINYRSFEPILRLLEVHHTPQCQHWAAWALANLTRVYPEKYCSLVEEEGGIPLLQALLASPTPYSRIKNLAKIVIVQCQHYKELEKTCVRKEDKGEITSSSGGGGGRSSNSGITVA